MSPDLSGVVRDEPGEVADQISRKRDEFGDVRRIPRDVPPIAGICHLSPQDRSMSDPHMSHESAG